MIGAQQRLFFPSLLKWYHIARPQRGQNCSQLGSPLIFLSSSPQQASSSTSYLFLLFLFKFFFFLLSSSSFFFFRLFICSHSQSRGSLCEPRPQKRRLLPLLSCFLASSILEYYTRPLSTPPSARHPRPFCSHSRTRYYNWVGHKHLFTTLPLECEIMMARYSPQ